MSIQEATRVFAEKLHGGSAQVKPLKLQVQLADEAKKLILNKADSATLEECLQKACELSQSDEEAEHLSGLQALAIFTSYADVPLELSVRAIGYTLDQAHRQRFCKPLIEALIPAFIVDYYQPIHAKFFEQLQQVWTEDKDAARYNLNLMINQLVGTTEYAKYPSDEVWLHLAELCIFIASEHAPSNKPLPITLKSSLRFVFCSTFAKVSVREKMLEKAAITLLDGKIPPSVKAELIEVLQSARLPAFARHEIMKLARVLAVAVADPLLATTKIANDKTTPLEIAADIWLSCVTKTPITTPQFRQCVIDTVIQTFSSRLHLLTDAAVKKELWQSFSSSLTAAAQKFPQDLHDHTLKMLKQFKSSAHHHGAANHKEPEQICTKLQRELNLAVRPRTLGSMADLVDRLWQTTNHEEAEKLALLLIDGVQHYEAKNFNVTKNLHNNVFKTVCAVVTDGRAHPAARETAAWTILNLAPTLPVAIADEVYRSIWETFAYNFPAQKIEELESQQPVVELLLLAFGRATLIGQNRTCYSLSDGSVSVETPNSVAQKRLRELPRDMAQLNYRPVAQLLFAKAMVKMYLERLGVYASDLIHTLQEVMHDCLTQPDVREKLAAEAIQAIETLKKPSPTKDLQTN